MKKSQAEQTSAENLEAKFDRGEEVLDYFDVTEAHAVLPTKHTVVSSIIENPQTTTSVREEVGHYGKTGDYAKRNETPGSKKKGEFMDNKKGGKPFKGVAKEPDKRRK